MICEKSVYASDPTLNIDGKKFHKECAKCADCGCTITTSNYTLTKVGDRELLLCKARPYRIARSPPAWPRAHASASVWPLQRQPTPGQP